MSEQSPTVEQFESLLNRACELLTEECRSGELFSESKKFENRVRQVIGSSHLLRADSA